MAKKKKLKTREALLCRAKLAKQLQEYAKMASTMKEFAETNLFLTLEERNLLAYAYKVLNS